MMFFHTIRGNIISIVIFQPSVLDDSFDLIPVMESTRRTLEEEVRDDRGAVYDDSFDLTYRNINDTPPIIER